MSKLKSQNSKNNSDKIGVKIKTEATSAKNILNTNKKSPAKEPQSMAELLAQTSYAFKSMKRGELLEAVVLSVTPKHLVLDIGGKSDAIVHEKEMPYIADIVAGLSPGTKITVTVVNPENDRGQTVVSLRKTAMLRRWEILAEKMKSQEEIDVIIREMTRGGFLVDYMGLRGFIPLSQMDGEFVKLGDRASGRRIKVKLLEVDRETNRLVFSQTSGGLGDKERAALSQIEIGKTYPAAVTGIAPFGAFVGVKIDDVSLPGLVHISEIAWEKVENTSDYVKVGQTIDVKVIGVDPKLGKLTLSLKQLIHDPWEDVTKVFSIDQTVKGKVSRLTQYGAFISLLPGIDGLIHISKMAPGEEPKVGEEIDCVIEEINPDKRKISLSLVTTAKPIGYR